MTLQRTIQFKRHWVTFMSQEWEFEGSGGGWMCRIGQTLMLVLLKIHNLKNNKIKNAISQHNLGCSRIFKYKRSYGNRVGTLFDLSSMPFSGQTLHFCRTTVKTPFKPKGTRNLGTLETKLGNSMSLLHFPICFCTASEKQRLGKSVWKQ